jgi:hypothetical protein
MGAILLILALLVLLVLAPLAGTDSRRLDDRDRRGWMPSGSRRR